MSCSSEWWNLISATACLCGSIAGGVAGGPNPITLVPAIIAALGSLAWVISAQKGLIACLKRQKNFAELQKKKAQSAAAAKAAQEKVERITEQMEDLIKRVEQLEKAKEELEKKLKKLQGED